MDDNGDPTLGDMEDVPVVDDQIADLLETRRTQLQDVQRDVMDASVPKSRADQETSNRTPPPDD